MPATKVFACMILAVATSAAVAMEPAAPAKARSSGAMPSPAASTKPIRIAGIDYTFVFDAARPAASGSRPAPDLLRALSAWLTANFELKKADALPNVRLESPAKITNFRFTGLLSDDPRLSAKIPPGQREVVAAYDDLSKTILLPVGWSGNSPTELSILVHEMVHHLQSEAKIRFACPAAAESLAYSAQDRWLQLFGRSLAADFEVDAFTLIAASLCLP
jgi:hypothetical protein